MAGLSALFQSANARPRLKTVQFQVIGKVICSSVAAAARLPHWSSDKPAI